MAWEKIIEEIDKVRQIVGEWQESGEMHCIEKEVVLDKLRFIYDGVKFATIAQPQTRLEANAESPEQKAEPSTSVYAEEKKDEVAEVANIYEVKLKSRHDRKKLMSLYGDTVDSHSDEIRNSAEQHPDTPKDRGNATGDTRIEEIVDMHAHVQTEDEMGEDVLAAMGLTGDTETENMICPDPITQKPPVADEVPHMAKDKTNEEKSVVSRIFSNGDKENGSSPKKVLGDTIQPEQTLADIYARNHKQEDVAERLKHESVHSIRGSIGINDRFILMRDLFNGDGQACDMTIRTLDGFSDLDDAMLYIHDNFAWNPESAGAKLLIDLLTRKLS